MTTRISALVGAAAALTLATGLALAAPGEPGHSHKSFAAGEPGDPKKPVARTIEVTMKETDDAKMLFEPNSIFASSVSSMVTSMVRATGFFGSPGSPAANDLWLWPGSPGAASASPVASVSAAAAPMRAEMRVFIDCSFGIGSCRDQ